VDAVFFDIGNVLVRFDARRLAARFAWRLRQRPLNAAELLLSSGWLDALERGRMTPAAFFRVLRDRAGFPDDFVLFRRLWCGHFALDRRAAAIAARVARRVPMYLLSNTNRMHYDFLRQRYAFPRLAQGVILSHEVGLRKPERGIYLEALRLSGTAAARTLFIDDRRENVAAARAAGLEAWQYRGSEPLAAKLVELGVL